jgi:hypothetical protein
MVTRIVVLGLMAACAMQSLVSGAASAQYRYTDSQGTVRTEQYKAKIPAEYRDASIWIGPTGTSSISKDAKSSDAPTTGSSSGPADRGPRQYYVWSASALNNYAWRRSQTAYKSQEDCEEGAAANRAKMARGGDALRTLGVVPPGGQWDPNILDKAADSVTWCLPSGDTPSSQLSRERIGRCDRRFCESRRRTRVDLEGPNIGLRGIAGREPTS